MNKIVTGILFLGLFTPFVCFATEEQTETSWTPIPEESLAAINAYFEPLVVSGHYRGLTTLVAQGGEIVHFESFGKRGSDEAVPTGKDSIYQIFSMTKPVTGVAMMMLWEEGKYRLDDPVSDYLPEFKNQRVYVSGEGLKNFETRPANRQMTIRDLMSHSAGLSYGWSDHPVDKAYRESGVSDLLYMRDIDLADFSRRLATIPLMFEPGQRFNYGLSVDVQARLVEVLSGMRFRDFLKDRLFDPLGMKDTDYWVPEDKWHRFSGMYNRDEGGQLVEADKETWLKFTEKPVLETGGHGLVSTAMDYWRFGQMLVNGGIFEGKRYLKSSTIDLMSENHLPKESPWRRWGDEISHGQGMGLNLGVVVDSTDQTGSLQVGEVGWNGAASTVFWADRENEVVVIALTNIMPYEANSIVDALQDAIHGPK